MASTTATTATAGATRVIFVIGPEFKGTIPYQNNLLTELINASFRSDKK